MSVPSKSNLPVITLLSDRQARVGFNSCPRTFRLKSNRRLSEETFMLPGVEMPHTNALVTVTVITSGDKEISACRGLTVNLSYMKLFDFTRHVPSTGNFHKESFSLIPVSLLSLSIIFLTGSHVILSAVISISVAMPFSVKFMLPRRESSLSSNLTEADSTLMRFVSAFREIFSMVKGTLSFHGITIFAPERL